MNYYFCTYCKNIIKDRNTSMFYWAIHTNEWPSGIESLDVCLACREPADERVMRGYKPPVEITDENQLEWIKILYE
jgi:hypothetical protein